MHPPESTCREIRAGVLQESEWRPRRDKHIQRLSPLVREHLDRASHSVAHPVMDFLFRYYAFSPGQLLRWSPGWGVLLAGAGEEEFKDIRPGQWSPDGWILDARDFPRARQDDLKRALALLKAVAGRPPRFGCFGLHEWAMVYRSPPDHLRHRQIPLRLSPAETDRVVETYPIQCSHYDAFRFFTVEARPLNRIQPSHDTRQVNEQPGCLHANMDLYKVTGRFYPWLAGELAAECFLLAKEIREVDMRASPYDLSAMGYEPICIETGEGREEYARQQEAFARAAAPLRARLIDALDGLLAAIETR